MNDLSRKTVVGVDVGGTFTDLFFLDEAAGTCGVAKVPSTKPDQSVGIRGGIGVDVQFLPGGLIDAHAGDDRHLAGIAQVFDRGSVDFRHGAYVPQVDLFAVLTRQGHPFTE